MDSEPERRAELSAKLIEWQEEIEALIPEPNQEYVPWEGWNLRGILGSESRVEERQGLL